MMNVTAKHGQAAVHLGGHELTSGRWSPACGTQHHNVGGREVTPLRPTDKPVTCKRCLKVIESERCGARVMHDAIGFGCVKTGKHTDHVTALDLKWREGEAPRDCTAKGCVECGRFDAKAFGKKLGKILADDHGLNFF